MKMILAMIPLAMTGVSLTAPDKGLARSEPQIIRWSAEAAVPGADWIELRANGTRMRIDLASDARLSELRIQLAGRQDGSVQFRLTREAGTLDCLGSAQRGRSEGACRFSADATFARELERRGIAVRRPDMLSLLLVDATLARVDGVAAQGLRVDDADSLMTVSAMDVDGAFVEALAGEGLRPSSLDEAVSAKALQIDVTWLREMAGAGLRVEGLDQAIELKAVGVDAAYARAITAVLTENDRVPERPILQ